MHEFGVAVAIHVWFEVAYYDLINETGLWTDKAEVCFKYVSLSIGLHILDLDVWTQKD